MFSSAYMNKVLFDQASKENNAYNNFMKTVDSNYKRLEALQKTLTHNVGDINKLNTQSSDIFRSIRKQSGGLGGAVKPKKTCLGVHDAEQYLHDMKEFLLYQLKEVVSRPNTLSMQFPDQAYLKTVLLREFVGQLYHGLHRLIEVFSEDQKSYAQIIYAIKGFLISHHPTLDEYKAAIMNQLSEITEEVERLTAEIEKGVSVLAVPYEDATLAPINTASFLRHRPPINNSEQKFIEPTISDSRPFNKMS